MPCSLAVTITKAVVVPEHLAALLTSEVVQQLVTAFTAQSPDFREYQPVRCIVSGETVIITLGSFVRRLLVTRNQVVANFPLGEQEDAEILTQLLSDLLGKGADRLFAAQVREQLSKKFGKVSQTSATVNNQGQQQKVTLLSFEV